MTRAPAREPAAPAGVPTAAAAAAFRRGDRDAFLGVYTAMADRVRPIIARFFPSALERDEAAQEIWLHVLRSAHLYDPTRGELLPWLRAVAANRCRELLRARGRRVQPDHELEEGELASLDDPPDTLARRSRVAAALKQFTAQLTGEEANVFRLSIVDERSHDDVAAALGISARRCKYLRSKLLRRALEDEGLRRALEEVEER